MSINQPSSRLPDGSPPNRQDGVVLMVALIILVAMTLAGVALIRSVDTANVIAGNLAFHQSATNAGERSTEQAVNWLAPKSGFGKADLYSDNSYNKEHGYLASREDRKANESWDAFWDRIQKEQGVTVQIAAPPPPLDPPPCPGNANADAACNTVRYVVQRLCTQAGKPNTSTNPCTQPPPSASSGGSQSAGGTAPAATKQVYYRITTRIEGPRRTVSYLQTIVAI